MYDHIEFLLSLGGEDALGPLPINRSVSSLDTRVSSNHCISSLCVTLFFLLFAFSTFFLIFPPSLSLWTWTPTKNDFPSLLYPVLPFYFYLACLLMSVVSLKLTNFSLTESASSRPPRKWNSQCPKLFINKKKSIPDSTWPADLAPRPPRVPHSWMSKTLLRQRYCHRRCRYRHTVARSANV